MKPSSFTIRIPEPCHEDWNTMQPDEKGKFCGSCCKSVVDFSGKTDTEIRDILTETQGQKVCGHFKKTQLDRPLDLVVNPGLLPRNIGRTRAFAIAVFLVFGSMLFSCTNHDDQVIGKIGMVMPIDSLRAVPEPENFLKGDTIVIDEIMPQPDFMGEVYVDGDIEVQETPVDTIPEIPAMDSILQPHVIENFVMGLIAPQVVQPDTSMFQVPDTLNVRGSREKSNPPTISEPAGLLIYPNPSAGEFTIRYDLLKRSNVRIDILDLKGSLLRTPVNVSAQYEGRYSIPVNISDLPNGIYIVSLTKDEQRFTEKVILEK